MTNICRKLIEGLVAKYRPKWCAKYQYILPIHGRKIYISNKPLSLVVLFFICFGFPSYIRDLDTLKSAYTNYSIQKQNL